MRVTIVYEIITPWKRFGNLLQSTPYKYLLTWPVDGLKCLHWWPAGSVSIRRAASTPLFFSPNTKELSPAEFVHTSSLVAIMTTTKPVTAAQLDGFFSIKRTGLPGSNGRLTRTRGVHCHDQTLRSAWACGTHRPQSHRVGGPLCKQQPTHGRFGAEIGVGMAPNDIPYSESNQCQRPSLSVSEVVYRHLGSRE